MMTELVFLVNYLFKRELCCTVGWMLADRILQMYQTEQDNTDVPDVMYTQTTERSSETQVNLVADLKPMLSVTATTVSTAVRMSRHELSSFSF